MELRNHYFKDKTSSCQMVYRREHAATPSKHAHNAHPSGIPFYGCAPTFPEENVRYVYVWVTLQVHAPTDLSF